MTNLLTHAPAVIWSLCVMVRAPGQLPVASTAASFGAGTALAHLTVTSAGILEITGGTPLVTRTSAIHVPGQPAVLLTLSVRVKAVPQPGPALTVTVCELALPEMEPLPVTDHEY